MCSKVNCFVGPALTIFTRPNNTLPQTSGTYQAPLQNTTRLEEGVAEGQTEHQEDMRMEDPDEETHAASNAPTGGRTLGVPRASTNTYNVKYTLILFSQQASTTKSLLLLGLGRWRTCRAWS
jgi:hypothetical protein